MTTSLRFEVFVDEPGNLSVELLQAGSPSYVGTLRPSRRGASVTFMSSDGSMRRRYASLGAAVAALSDAAREGRL